MVAARLKPVGQVAIRKTAGDGIQDARTGRGVIQPKVVAMQQVVGGLGVQIGDIDVLSIAPITLQGQRGMRQGRQYAADHEINHHAAHMRQEFADGRQFTGLVGFFDGGILAVSFERRPGGGPDKVRSADAGIPKLAQAQRDVGAHLF